MTSLSRYEPLNIDKLGFLRTQISSLSGYETLAYELIQNADDVKDELGQAGTTHIIFDVCDDALYVINDGVFLKRDFDRLGNIASGGKRDEEGTTGNFGIGFIAVYLITDSPEIMSSGEKRQFFPAAADNKNIRIDPHETVGTIFRLPWAFDANSEVRNKLGLQAIRLNEVDKITLSFVDAIKRASVFLKQLKQLEVKRNGNAMCIIRRDQTSNDRLTLVVNGTSETLHILSGDFGDRASELKTQFVGSIPKKRQASVKIAIPENQITNGLLYATLPTQETISLPFYINADFLLFPDRKRVQFDKEYQGAWNRAAIRAAAQILKKQLYFLPSQLGHKRLWQLLSLVRLCIDEVETKRSDECYAYFWHELAPILRQHNIIYTADKRWISPEKAYFLSSAEGRAATQSLRLLGFDFVHPDLTEYHNLMRRTEIGVNSLTLTVLENAIKQCGHNKTVDLVQAHESFKHRENRILIYAFINSLVKNDNKERKRFLNSCAIVLGSDSIFHFILDLRRRPNVTTAALFPYLWLHQDDGDHDLMKLSVDEFTLNDAIASLKRRADASLVEEWQKTHELVADIFIWIAERFERFDESQKQDLAKLSIWPSLGKLYPLSELSLPGDFEDPLKLENTRLLDLSMVALKDYHLLSLGVKELTFVNYVRGPILNYLKSTSFTVVKLEDITNLLSQHLDKIRDDRELKNRLQQDLRIKCKSGKYCYANQAYFETPDVLSLLGTQATLAIESSQQVKSLYSWLGVAQSPRPNDLIAYIQKTCLSLPNSDIEEWLIKVVKFLGREFNDNSEQFERNYGCLKRLTWLTGRKDKQKWYLPTQLYAAFQDYLFESQVEFLGMPRNVQSECSKLIEWLGIRSVPMTDQVVKHVLYCSRLKQKVNLMVYAHLNSNWIDPSILLLEHEAFLYCQNRYYCADQVFWNDPKLGRYRQGLSKDFEQYRQLLEKLGVREAPSPTDYICVLGEISEKNGKNVLKDLPERDDLVVEECWKQLGAAHREGGIESEALSSLKSIRVILDKRCILQSPQNIFIEDRPDLAAKFPNFIENNVIQPIIHPGVNEMMEVVGVRRLSSAAQLSILETGMRIEDQQIHQQLEARKRPLLRVLASAHQRDPLIQYEKLTSLNIQKVDELKARYTIDHFNQHRESKPESFNALYMRHESVLYVCIRRNKFDWLQIAREFVFRLNPGGDPNLAGAIEGVLSSDSAGDADLRLDELNYPHYQMPSVEVPIPSILLTTEQVSTSNLSTSSNTTTKAIDSSENKDSRTSSLLLSENKQSKVDNFDRNSQAEEVAKTTSLSPVNSQSSISLNAGNQPRSESIENKMVNREPTNTYGQQPERNTDGAKPKKRHANTARLRSYVIPEGEKSLEETNPDLTRRRQQVDDAGIKFVENYELKEGRQPTTMHHSNKGYDILSMGKADEPDRVIEVKSLNGAWAAGSPAALSAAQFINAQEKGPRFWLYVVEYALEIDRTHLIMIQNPAQKIGQFLFDDGWREVADLA